MINGKKILITGGTGSFGQRFTETLLKDYSPKKIIIYSRDEYKQFEMRNRLNHKNLRFFLGDVRDLDRLKMALKDVDIVIHAAALKQVPAAEYNPFEFVKTNIHGAENVVNASISEKVKKIIALSTDKAANPINLYGATKLASDKIFIAANSLSGSQKTTFSVVRYGNVLGSRGSVVPYFISQAKKNKKYLNVTDKKMTRFWITLDQGVEFVINCLKNMKGKEIFVPKIPSVKITDLVKAIGPKLKIKIIGVRPGEKIHEIMCPQESNHLTLEFKNLFIILSDLKDIHKYRFQNKKGMKVNERFEYSSENNTFLKIQNIQNLIKPFYDSV